MMLLQSHYRRELCDSNLSYEFIPLNDQQFELENIGKELEEKNVQVEINTPFMISLRLEGTKISFFLNGKILIKNVSDEKHATRLFEKILEFLNSCRSVKEKNH
jgi:hypothetical protein